MNDYFFFGLCLGIRSDWHKLLAENFTECVKALRRGRLLQDCG